MRSLSRAFYVASSVWPMPIWRWIGRWMFRGLRTQRIGTIAIGTNSSAAVASDLLSATAAAIRLIEEADPRRFSRIMRDVDRIIITEFNAAVGAHFPHSRTCFISTRFVQTYPVANLAILIAHEATHARLDAMRIRLYPDLRARIERRCGLEEVAFARRLTGRHLGAIQDWIDHRVHELEIRSQRTALPVHRQQKPSKG
jgi:hypothetical protein